MFIKEIDEIAKNVPRVAAKMKEANALRKLSWKKNKAEAALDFQESLAEL